MTRLFFFFLFMFLGLSFLFYGNDILIQYENSDESRIRIVEEEEVIQGGKRLPTSGGNFETYSRFLSTIGRTHVHSRLRPVILQSYARLATTFPNLKWIYAETGWRNGGKFWPHRTHRNGLSVDFIVPVINKDTKDIELLSLSIFNLFGYQIRFDDQGIAGLYKIDFSSMIQHLLSLREACAKNGLKIKRVIFDPPLLKLLKSEPSFHLISDIDFMKTKAWFPHDSHYHVEFEIVN